MKRLSIVAISLILLVNFSCKSSKIKDPNKVNDKVLLTIKDYIIENKYDSNIDLVLEITNNSSEPIYILKASEDNFALPSLYDVSINPKIESYWMIKKLVAKEKLPENINIKLIIEDLRTALLEITGEYDVVFFDP